MKPLAVSDLEHIRLHTSPLWNELRGQAIFHSGATGFLGAWMLESLLHCNRVLNLDLSVTVLSRDPDAFAERMPHVARESSITLLQGDVCNFTFPEREFAYVIHGAASTSAEAASRPVELLSTLVDGTQRMLMLARQSQTKKFLFVSSGAVYGKQPERTSHISEDYLGGPDWLTPEAAYAEGKRVAEQMCALDALESSTEIGIARCFAFVGPHLPLNRHFAIGNFIADALAGRAIEIRGDGTPLRSYLYAADLAIWLWTMLFRPNPDPTKPLVLNVGSGNPISIRDLAKEVADELQPGLPIKIAVTPSPGVPPLQYVPDVRRAEVELGLRQTFTLRESIRRTADWHSR